MSELKMWILVGAAAAAFVLHIPPLVEGDDSTGGRVIAVITGLSIFVWSAVEVMLIVY